MSAENPDLKPCHQSSEPSANLDQRLCSRISADQPSLTKSLVSTSFSPILASLAVTALLAAAPELAIGQKLQPDDSAAARAGAIAHAQKMQRLFPDVGGDTQSTPPVIPELEIDPDPSGAVATFQPSGPTITAKNAFFQNLGTNGRTCGTCHLAEDAWSLSAQHARDRFEANPDDPLFRLIDGATCPSDDVSTYKKSERPIICYWRKD